MARSPWRQRSSSQVYWVLRDVLHEEDREEHTKGTQIPADTNSVKNNINVHHFSAFMENGSSYEPLSHVFIVFCILSAKHAATKIKK